MDPDYTHPLKSKKSLKPNVVVRKQEKVVHIGLSKCFQGFKCKTFHMERLTTIVCSIVDDNV